MSKKYLVILAVQFIIMAMCLIFATYQHTLAESARDQAVRNAELAQDQAQEAEEHSVVGRDIANRLAECERELQECRSAAK